MTFHIEKPDREERKRMQEKYQIMDPYTRSLADWYYRVTDDNRQFFLTAVGLGRGRKEQMPTIYTMICPDGIINIYVYEKSCTGEHHISVDRIDFSKCQEENKGMYKEAVKQALIAYNQTQYIQVFIDEFPKY